MSMKSKMVAKARSVASGANISLIMGSKLDRTKAGAPTEAGKLLELCWDSTNSDVYINTDGGTTWAKIVD